MSIVFGPIQQNGYIVENLDAAILYWAKVLGVGPFFKIDRIPLEYFQYRGAQIRPQIAVGLAYSGELQIELIQQIDNSPSPYVDFVRDHGYGLQHVGAFSVEYDRDLARIETAGIPTEVRGKLRHGPRFQYFENRAIPGTRVEFAELIPEMAMRTAYIQKTAATWDGRDPVRPYSMTAVVGSKE